MVLSAYLGEFYRGERSAVVMADVKGGDRTTHSDTVQ